MDNNAGQLLREKVASDPGMSRFQQFSRLLANGPVRVEASRYDYQDLWRFKTMARAALFPLGVHRLDLDESDGVIRASVATAAEVAVVAQRALVIGIPPGALVVDVRERARRLTSLSDRIRDVPAGVLIDDGGGGCTLTVNAFMTTSEEWGFFTASHCTPTFGAVDSNDPMYQNTVGTGNLIGWEVKDPPLYQPGVGYCPGSADYGCRLSDAAFYVYNNNSLPDSATIARTTNSSGSTTISGTHPRFGVSGVSTDTPYEGMDIYKIGISSGWTAGEVTEDTCVDIESEGIVTWCSAVASLVSQGGDSGAPIFTWDGSSGYVEVVGILWGGTGCCTTYYTPWLYVFLEVEGELGEILNYAY